MTAFKYLGKKPPQNIIDPDGDRICEKCKNLAFPESPCECDIEHYRGALKEAAKEILRFAENYGDSDPQYTLYNEMPRIAKMVLVSAGENE